MSRIIRSRRFTVLGLLCILAGLAWAAIIAADRLTADEDVAVPANCIGCSVAKVYVPPLTDDPDVNLANWQAAKAISERQTRALYEAAHKEHLKKFNTWHGTTGSVALNVVEADRPLYNAIASIFAADPPAPEARKNEFAMYLNGQSEFKCVGWCAIVSSVTQNDEGQVITVRVGPHLMRAAGKVVFTPRECVETWHVSKAGKLEFVRVESVVGANSISID